MSMANNQVIYATGRVGQRLSAYAEPVPPPIKPLDPPMVPIAVVGTAIWGVAWLVSLALRDRLAAQGHAVWPQICLAGFLIGVFGIGLMLVREVYRRRRGAIRPPGAVHPPSGARPPGVSPPGTPPAR
jgi:hypothetical protein